MPKTLMLSHLSGKEDLGDAGQGRYVRLPKGDLEKIYRQIDVPDIGNRTASIPDMWAQPIRFQQALINGDEAVRAQWRGLLALYVLRGELRVEGRLELRPVFHPGDAAEPTSFLRVAKALLPDALTMIPIGWESIHLLLFDGRPLGCTSPLTFLCPAASIGADIAIPNCGWFANGVFSDPIPRLVGARLHALRGWLVAAQTSLQDHPAQYAGTETPRERMAELDAARAHDLLRAIAAFLADIDRVMPPKPSSVAGIEVLHRGQYRLTGIVQRFLGYAPVVNAAGVTEQLRNSSFLLQKAPDAGEARPILILSDSFRNLPAFQGGRVEVYGGLTLIDALEAYRSEDHGMLGDSQLDPGRVYTATEIFTDTIFYTPSPNAFPGAVAFQNVDKMTVSRGTGSMTPVLPLRSDFAAHFTTEYLRQNVSFSGDSEKIAVTLNIRLNPLGVSGGAPIPILKTYTREQIRSGPIPEVRVWPEYDGGALPGWKEWFTFYDDLAAPSNKLVVSPVPPGGNVGGIVSTGIIDSTDRRKQIKVHQSGAFPEKLYCSLDGKEVGVLLPAKLERREHPHVELWKIGIDFGTTGTSVFYRAGTPSSLSTPATLPLLPHLRAISSPPITESYGFFLPTDTENVDGILSVFRDFHPMSGDMQIKPFHDGHISFVDRSEQGFLTGVNANGICANMKWGSAAERARAKAFLKQLCLLTALQARIAGAHKVDWVFSYPLSFSGDRAGEFEQTWAESRRFACLASGYPEPADHARELHFNESICAALYARDRMGAGLRSGAMILDIGGGSSDISVWAGEGSVDNASLFNASVKLGGRDIFQRPLLRGRPSVLEMLVTGSSDRAYVKQIASLDSETLGFSKIDSLFKRDSGKAEAMQTILSNLDNARGEPDVVAFCKLLGLGLQGLFYYAGLLLRHKQAQAGEGKKLLDGYLPDVYVCGNGSKIFYWLGAGSFSSEAEKGLLSAFAAGAGSAFTMRPGAKIRISPYPKTEAAYGMLIAEGKEQFESQQVVSGEAFRYRDKEYGLMDVVPYDTLDGAAFTIPDGLPGLHQALEAMNHRPLTSEIERGVRESVLNKLADIAKRRASTAIVEHEKREEEQPIFIMELVELIRRATADWKEGKPSWW